MAEGAGLDLPVEQANDDLRPMTVDCTIHRERILSHERSVSRRELFSCLCSRSLCHDSARIQKVVLSSRALTLNTTGNKL